MLTVSSSSILSNLRRFTQHHRQHSSDLYRPRTILIDKPSATSSYGFSIQTYGFASLNLLSTDESACSFLSLSTESTTSRKSSTSNSFSSSNPSAPIQLVTYVDQVQDKGPAWQAGLRPGSVILSVNDQTVEHDDHETLVKRITQSSATQLKLVVIQQNINKQIALAEKLQQLHRQLQEKQDEFDELCKQELICAAEEEEEGGGGGEDNDEGFKSDTLHSPSPRLNRLSTDLPERKSSFCHDKIPPDWRQSVANFAHQQTLTTRTLLPILSSSSSLLSTKYIKNRSLNISSNRQRSLSLSTIVFHYSKANLSRLQTTIRSNHRRALSYDDLMFSTKNQSSKHDESLLTSGCSLAMDLSRSFDRKNSQSSSTLDTDDDDDDDDEREQIHLDSRIKQFKWKLRISK